MELERIIKIQEFEKEVVIQDHGKAVLVKKHDEVKKGLLDKVGVEIKCGDKVKILSNAKSGKIDDYGKVKTVDIDSGWVWFRLKTTGTVTSRRPKNVKVVKKKTCTICTWLKMFIVFNPFHMILSYSVAVQW